MKTKKVIYTGSFQDKSGKKLLDNANILITGGTGSFGRKFTDYVLKKSNSWYHFKDFEDDQGWIHKSLLGKISAVITKKDHCNIRSGPGTGNDILYTVEKGIPFKVIKRKGSWLHIEHADGDKGWVYDSLVW